MSKRFLRLPEVMRRTGYGRSSIYQKERDGTFPARIKLGCRAAAWLESDIDAWIESRLQAAQNGQIAP